MKKVLILSLIVVILVVCAVGITVYNINKNKATTEYENTEGLEEHKEFEGYEDWIDPIDYAEYIKNGGEIVDVICAGTQLSTNEKKMVFSYSDFGVSLNIPYDMIKEAWYWFDNDEPQQIDLPTTVPGVGVNDPYSNLNIKVKYVIDGEEQEVTYIYQFDTSTYIIGMLESKNVIDDKTYFTVNGNEYYISIFPEHEVGEIVFLTAAGGNGGFVAPYGIGPNKLDNQKYVSSVDGDSFDIVSNGKTTTYSKYDIYSNYSYLCYAELDSENKLVNFESSMSKNHDNFELQPNDIVFVEAVNVGAFTVIRQNFVTKEHETFFKENNSDGVVISSNIINVTSEKSVKTIRFDRNLEDDEKLKISIKSQDKEVVLFNDNYKNKTYEIEAKDIYDKAKELSENVDGLNIDIVVEISKNDEIISSKSFNTNLIIENGMEVTVDLTNGLKNKEDIIVKFGRKLNDYEGGKISLYLDLGDGTHDTNMITRREFGMLSAKMQSDDIISEMEDGNFKLDIKKLKRGIRKK